MMKRSNVGRLALTVLAALAAVIALYGRSPSAVAKAGGAQAVCVFSNPGFAGSCTETTDVTEGSSPRQACEVILACLNDSRCVKAYCGATTIRQGWALESAKAAQAQSSMSFGQGPPEPDSRAGDGDPSRGGQAVRRPQR
jgi:hypothetical protein